MKNWRMALMIVLSVVFVTFIPTLAEQLDGQRDQMYFPYALQVIEESAFERTAFVEVYLHRNVVRINGRAFADNPSLSAIYIPPSTEYIADDAFWGDDRLVIYGVEGSCAQEWAEEHEIPFKICDIWELLLENQTGLRLRAYRRSNCIDTDREGGGPEPVGTLYIALPAAPKERPEMYPIDYDFP